MDFKNVSIIVKAIFLILFCIQMISSVLASESATFAQIIAATEVAYVLQKTYNSSMLVEPIEQDYVDGLSIKPPNRYGHTMIRRGKLFGENKNIRDIKIINFILDLNVQEIYTIDSCFVLLDQTHL